MIDRTLSELVERHLGSPFKGTERLEGGDEACVFLLKGERGPVVLHLSPPWRSRSEMEWSHSAVIRVNKSVKEAVKPIHGRDGTVFEWNGRCAAIYTFVAGKILDREDTELRMEAARLLSSIHNALIGWAPGPRPVSRSGRPVAPPDVDELKDPELDAWWHHENEKSLLIGPTHGDYYRGNLICRSGKIEGIIDWLDVAVRPLSVELAGAAFEFCRSDDYVLDISRVREFIKAYCSHGGPVPDREIEMLLPFMRWWVREDARNSFAETPGPRNEYGLNQVRNFVALRDICLDL